MELGFGLAVVAQGLEGAGLVEATAPLPRLIVYGAIGGFGLLPSGEGLGRLSLVQFPLAATVEGLGQEQGFGGAALGPIAEGGYDCGGGFVGVLVLAQFLVGHG